MKKTIIILILGLISISCIQRSPKGTDLVILDSLASEKLRIAFLTDTTISNKPRWIPTYNQLNLIDTITKDEIRKLNRHLIHLRVDSIGNYYRQFVCTIDSTGDSLIYINAMYKVHEIPYEEKKGNNIYFRRFDWQHEILKVHDGGDLFWQIQINLSKKRCEFFSVNGEA